MRRREQMNKFQVPIWDKNEYTYQMALGFVPNIMAYLHDENKNERPSIVIVPGGGYCVVSPTEGEIVARRFYDMGFHAFVLTYTTNLLMSVPLLDQPMKDLSRAIRLIRSNAEIYHLNPNKLFVCGFSAGAHLCGSICVHYNDIQDKSELYSKFSNRPDAAILSYPVITSGEFAHQDSFKALLGADIYEQNKNEWLDYMSLEKYVTEDTPPCFLWQTVEDELVSVENSSLFARACRKQAVPFAYHVFSKGKHGLSLADSVWASKTYGEPYTMEQTLTVIKAIKKGALPVPEEMKQLLLQQFDFEENGIELKQETNQEVEIWPELVRCWLETLKESSNN